MCGCVWKWGIPANSQSKKTYNNPLGLGILFFRQTHFKLNQSSSVHHRLASRTVEHWERRPSLRLSNRANHSPMLTIENSPAPRYIYISYICTKRYDVFPLKTVFFKYKLWCAFWAKFEESHNEIEIPLHILKGNGPNTVHSEECIKGRLQFATVLEGFSRKV